MYGVSIVPPAKALYGMGSGSLLRLSLASLK
ncbi:Uncharacterised protein [Vibrio cholerae]|nr:Uncharacterised protein [Vibrio cholerae]CSI73257.1 Uncharacterised protein [Vibrio cholerae]